MDDNYEKQSEEYVEKNVKGQKLPKLSYAAPRNGHSIPIALFTCGQKRMEDFNCDNEIIDGLVGHLKKTPYVGADGYWYVWDTDVAEYVKSGCRLCFFGNNPLL